MTASDQVSRWIGWAIFVAGALVCGCPPPGQPTVPAPSDEVLIDHLSHGAVRCGAAGVGTSNTVGQSVTSVPVLIRHRHAVGGSFRLQSLRYELNGVTICQLDLPRSRALETGRRVLTVFSGRLPVGAYLIRQNARYRGHGFGVFSYLRGYRFRVAGRGRFTVRPGTPLCVDIEAMERHASTLAKRLRVRIRIQPRCAALRRKPPHKPPGKSPAALPVVVPPPAPSPKKVRRPGARAPGR